MDNQELPKKSNPSKIISVLMMEAGIEFAVLIGGPLIAGVYAGKWLDSKLHHNFFVIIGILAGLGVTIFAIYKRVKAYQEIFNKRNSE